MAMDVTELDEGQGLTGEMVDSWLAGHGWKLKRAEPQGSYQPPGKFWTKAEIQIWQASALKRFPDFAAAESMSVQALLREINPRMRKGAPSKAARDAMRPCYWLAAWIAGGRYSANLWDSDLMDHFAESPHDIAGWFFWPCDRYSNKIRWPTDAAGNML